MLDFSCPIAQAGETRQEIVSGFPGVDVMAIRERLRRSRRTRLPICRAYPPGVEGLESRQLLAFGVTQYPLNMTTDALHGMVTGSDGNLWFTAANQTAIGMFDPRTLTETDFPLGPQNGVPYLMVAGPDGNLWFTDNSPSGQIATINPTTHAITQLAVTNPDSIVGIFDDLAFDGNGKLWLLEGQNRTDNGRVVEFDPTTNAFTVFSPPASNTRLGGITEGPDGSVWFTESDANLVTRIDPTTHQMTEYPVAGVGPYSITLGPDGNLWYTLSSASPMSATDSGAIGTINATTHATAAYPTADLPFAIAAGPGNHLTYVRRNNRLGVIDVATKSMTGLLASMAPADGSAENITSGPSNDVYFTGYLQPGGSIGHVSILADNQTALASAPNPVTFGNAVTLTATVTPASSGPVPTGMVTFFEGSTSIGTSLLNPSGVATLNLNNLSVGTHTFTSRYLGDATYGQSASNAVNQTIVAIATTTTLEPSPSAITFGQSLNLISTVHDASGNPVSIGDVDFYEILNGRKIHQGYGSLVNGLATFTFPATQVQGGTHEYGADFLGLPTLARSSSNAVQVSVARVATAVALMTTPNPQTTGRPITLTATVTPSATGIYQDGFVTFFDGTVAIGGAGVDYNGVATFTVAALPAGDRVLTAAYSGDVNFLPSTSNTLTQHIITIPGTITTIYPTPNPTPIGMAYSLTVTVAPIPTFTAAGRPISAPVPNGMVSLYEFGTLIAVAPVDATGKVVFSYLASFQIGQIITYSASYSGNTTYSPSSSNTVTEIFSAPDGPHVQRVTTAGARSSTKKLVIHFNEPLYQPTSEDINNYKIIAGSTGRARIQVRRAVLNASNNTITLTLRSPVPLNGRYNLTVVGMGLHGVSDTNGFALDGGFTGLPGSNFFTPLTLKNVFVATK
jgi:streptogramin lyase